MSQEVADEVYALTDGFPESQKNRLADQLCRAADSISHNLAEGCGRASKREKSHFFHISLGSINEADNGLVRAFRLHLVLPAEFDPLALKVKDARKMLVSLIRKVENS